MMMRDALEDSDKNHETEMEEFELVREERNGAINSRMTNVYRADGSVSDNPTFQSEIRFGTNQESRAPTSMIRSFMN